MGGPAGRNYKFYISMKKEKEIIRYMVKMGGYWYFNIIFPFIHFKEESIFFSSDTGLYKYNPNKKLEKVLKI